MSPDGWCRKGVFHPLLAGRQSTPAELIGYAGRPGHELIVIGVDPVRLQILQLGLTAEIGRRHTDIKQILVRDRIRRLFPG